MKTRKLNLDELKINSFVTEIKEIENKTIEGGTGTSIIERNLTTILRKPEAPSTPTVIPKITGPSWGETFCGGWKCAIIGY